VGAAGLCLWGTAVGGAAGFLVAVGVAGEGAYWRGEIEAVRGPLMLGVLAASVGSIRRAARPTPTSVTIMAAVRPFRRLRRASPRT